MGFEVVDAYEHNLARLLDSVVHVSIQFPSAPMK